MMIRASNLSRKVPVSLLSPHQRRVGIAAAVAASATVAALAAIAGCGGAHPPKPAPRSTVTAPAVPKYSHVVVVIEENHSYSDIIGDTADAPYINRLAGEGALMTSSYGVTHPSEPNYMALFSGSTDGLTSDSCPVTSSAPSLGSELLAAGDAFKGYSEGLPAAGSTVCTSGEYARKHAPWVNFTHVPASDSVPFSSFPGRGGYSSLPAVSFVIPNLNHDMHDGTVAQGDAWLKSNLSGYAQWAKSHHSLLIVTWDEDDSSGNNRIPTIIAGQGVKTGAYSQTVNHYSVLATIEQICGLRPLGASASVNPVTNIWSS